MQSDAAIRREPMRKRWASLATLVTLGAAGATVAALPAGAVDLVSRALNGNTGNAASLGVASNADGTVVAFHSDADNLVSGDFQGVRDVFVWDSVQGVLDRVSVDSDGKAGNRASHGAGGAPSVSADGNLVAFYSDAFNLVPGDDNGHADVFVHTRDAGIGRMHGITERVSVRTDGLQGNGPSLFPSMSADGRYVAFQSLASNLVDGDTNGVADIFIHDRASGETERACDAVQANGFSFAPALSADGNTVAFASAATNLVPNDTNRAVDVFVCSRSLIDGSFRNGTIERVSLATSGIQGNADSILPAISGSGCHVAFKSEASNLFPDDRNNAVDVFVRLRGANVTELISAKSLAAGSTTQGSSANDISFPPSVSGDGRFIAFGSFATNLLVGDTNGLPSVYVRDRQTGGIRLVDVNAAGRQADGATPDAPPSLSSDATRIGFVSAASNLTPEGIDRNDTFDVFIADNVLGPATIENVCCECADETCADPENGICPTGCVAVCHATCSDPGVVGVACSPLTPPSTPTATSTPDAGGTATETATPDETATPTPDETATPTEPSPTDTPAPTTAAATPTETPTTPEATVTATTPSATVTPGTATPGTATPGTATPGTATPGTATPGTATPVPTTAGPATFTPTRTITAAPTASATSASIPRRWDDDSCAVLPAAESRSRAGWLLLPALGVWWVRRSRPRTR